MLSCHNLFELREKKRINNDFKITKNLNIKAILLKTLKIIFRKCLEKCIKRFRAVYKTCSHANNAG